ncbi:MAG: D-aminoacylase, partial [Haliea sp.]|nr:D-aminoacylase [Haliea sp.]
TIFHLDEVQERDMKRVFDVPDGKGGFTWRWSRDAAPMRMTMVNGEVTFDGQQSTSARPGKMLQPLAAA